MNRKITFIMDGNFHIHDTELLSPHMHYDAFLRRFSSSFDCVTLVARAFPVERRTGLRVLGPKCEFVALPSYRGPYALLKALPKLFKIIWDVVRESDILVLRLPGNVANIAALICMITGKPYTVEVVADPADYFSPQASNSKIRRLAKFLLTTSTRLFARRARLARYVTTRYLQTRYPTKGKSIGFSDVFIPHVRPFMVAPRLKSRPLELICAAMMHNHSKGHHYLIDSVRCLMLKNINVSCTLIGEGRIRRELEEYSTLIGVSDRIRFLGLIPSSSEVQRLISTADVFVLPSFQEGLPRSLIEALASGTICIGSNAGGIPEVLPHSLIFEKGDTESLSTLVEKLATCNDFYKKAIVDCMDAFDSFAPASLDRMQKTYVEELCL